MEDFESIKDFRHNFCANGIQYTAHIQHYDAISEDDIIDYKVVEEEFLVRLYSIEGCQTFKVSMNDGSVKQTDSSRIAIDCRMIGTIGLIIEMACNPWLLNFD